jgi:hypothetical protein
MSADMELVVDTGGGVRCIYDETLDLRALGKLQITRASHVEPDSDGNWWADIAPVGGPVLGPFGTRGEALLAERGWLTRSPALNLRVLLGEVERQRAFTKKPQSGLTKHPPQ